jgi:hypothetical protein
MEKKSLSLLALWVCLAGLSCGCQTFNYTKEDEARELNQIYQRGLLDSYNGTDRFGKWDNSKTKLIR